MPLAYKLFKMALGEVTGRPLQKKQGGVSAQAQKPENTMKRNGKKGKRAYKIRPVFLILWRVCTVVAVVVVIVVFLERQLLLESTYADGPLTASEEAFQQFQLEYVPQNFKLKESFCNSELQVAHLRYENANKKGFVLTQTDVKAVADSVSADDPDAEIVQISGLSAYYISRDGKLTLFWKTTRYSFLLTTDANCGISKQELFRIAENMKNY